ncbi:MAG: DUF4437 domain-containing protein [Sphingomonadales bacterium]|nr:DUF4437 domain-containing protein [Sphingomonadales bacterium]
MIHRPHIEFLQSQLLPWRRIGPGLARPDAEYKLLSRDPGDGACSALMRYAPGWSREGPEHLLAAEEFYVLDGALYGRSCLSGGQLCIFASGLDPEHMAAPDGCVLLAFYDAEPTLVAGIGTIAESDRDRAIPHIDAAGMPWDTTLNDEKLKHLGISRKNLRTDPVTGERTFLSLIFPQSAPTGNKGPQEMHPVVEEAYIIAGSLTGPQGTMYPGAYFWRPPGIAHGPFGARWGAVSLIRFVGGRHVNQWTKEEAPFSFDTAYQPILPPDLQHLAQAHWLPPSAY